MAFSGEIPMQIIRNQGDWKRIFGEGYSFAVKMTILVSNIQTTDDQCNLHFHVDCIFELVKIAVYIFHTFNTREVSRIICIKCTVLSVSL